MILGMVTTLFMSAPILDVLQIILDSIQQFIVENRFAAAVIGLACAGLFVIVSAQIGLRRAIWILAGLIFVVGALRIAEDLVSILG